MQRAHIVTPNLPCAFCSPLDNNIRVGREDSHTFRPSSSHLLVAICLIFLQAFSLEASWHLWQLAFYGEIILTQVSSDALISAVSTACQNCLCVP